jgi:hypothetical protein
MNDKRYFIDSVQTFSSTNNKGRELQALVKGKFEGRIVGGIEPFKTMLKDITDTVAMLNEQYPRTKPFEVKAYKTEQIEVTAGQATLLSSNTVLRMFIQVIRGTLTAMSDGRLHKTGGQ